MPFDFEKLKIYQKGVEFADGIYRLTKEFPETERYGLSSQLRRAALSISLNIAEGSGRSKKEFKHFLVIARTSAHECVPILEISYLQGYITDKQKVLFRDKCTELVKMICGLINKL